MSALVFRLVSPRGRRTRDDARHRGARRRSLRVTLAMLIAGTGTMVALDTPPATAVTPPVTVPASNCAQYDPNLVSGLCLQYESNTGIALTWIGTYRATDGSIFYCIDYLFDSRIDASAARVSTANLHNQLNMKIGAGAVAALNYMMSTHAPNGSAGSANGDAAIALIIREVMSDGIRDDGTVVYPPHLKVNGTVKPLPGGAPEAVMNLAQKWWDEASQKRGPWQVVLTRTGPDGNVPLGQSVTYKVQVLSATGKALAGPSVALTCTGPISCPAKVAATAAGKSIKVTPTALGTYTVQAKVSGPAAQGRLLKGPWSTHGGTTAINGGVQRGWIAQEVKASASAQGTAQVVKATPEVVTQAQPTAQPGDSLTDLVTVSNLPAGYDQTMTATLYGPFAVAPTTSDCIPENAVGAVSMPLRANGTLRTPSIDVARPGYYVWTESLPGDGLTNAVTTPCAVAAETTVVQTTPRATTVLSAQKATQGARLQDTIEVTDSFGLDLDIAWSLLGPLAPAGTDCQGLDWDGAPVAAQGTVTAHGDGRYVTEDADVAVAGCYTYVERIAATALSTAHATKPGEPTETALIFDWPQVQTTAASTSLTLPATVSDAIAVTGLTSSSITIDWQLLGPMAPGTRDCEAVDWSGAAVLASGSIDADHDGTVNTPEIAVTEPGCYTFTERSDATATAAEAESPAGLPEETVLLTRPPLPFVPEVPTGPSRSTWVDWFARPVWPWAA